MVRDFRAGDADTPIVLMGYYNPIYVYGVDRFLADAREAGVDGLIVVDLPPEEDDELCLPALEAGLNFIRLATPTTDDKRLPAVLANTSGFVYYVSVTGITGSAVPDYSRGGERGARASSGTPTCRSRSASGSRRPESAAAVAAHADGVVVGTALIDVLAADARRTARATPSHASTAVSRFVRRTARRACARRADRVKPPGDRAMSWIHNVVPPKIRSFLKKETPENLWVKCPDSGQLVFHKDLENNLFVVPGSDYHMRMGAERPARRDLRRRPAGRTSRSPRC